MTSSNIIRFDPSRISRKRNTSEAKYEQATQPPAGILIDLQLARARKEQERFSTSSHRVYRPRGLRRTAGGRIPVTDWQRAIKEGEYQLDPHAIAQRLMERLIP